MDSSRTTICYVTAVITGLVSWMGILLLAGIVSGNLPEALRREAWDIELYWMAGLPLCYLVAGALGYVHPYRVWRWPATTIATHGACLLLFSGSGFSLLPLGVILLAVLALPGVLTAWIGRCARRFRDAAAARS